MPAHIRAITVGLTAVKLLEINDFRTSIGIVNNDSTAIVYWAVQDPAVATVNGFPIYPRGSVTLVLKDGDETRQALYAVADVAGTSVRVYESVVAK